MSKNHKQPLEYVNLFLLKAATKKAESALAAGKIPKRIDAVPGALPGGELYYSSPPASAVGWSAFLRPAFGANLPSLRSMHASAVLFFRTNGRIFAATFGYGRSLLADDKLEPDFGLRTALQLCDPDSLSAVDYRTIEERTRVGRMQLSDMGAVTAFRLDFDTDLMRGLEARCKDPKTCERLAARWASLTVGARITVSELPALAGKLLKAYQTKKLPAQFAWIDNVKRVTDPTVLAALDQQLETRLDNGNHSGIRLAVPEVLGSTDDSEIKFFGSNGPDFDSAVQVYLDARPRKLPSTIAAAKNNHQVVLVDPTNGQKRTAFSVYHCLIAEIEHTGKLYLLADREWFSLNRGFVQSTNQAINRIPILAHKLPAWNPPETEGAWNERACTHWADAAYLDRGNIQYGGGNSKIEPGDFLTKGKVIAHAKRRDKNSSGLSHMFSQGAVSAQIIRQDRSFRTAIANRLPASHADAATALKKLNFDPTKWTVAYVVLGADSKSPAADLPFFSKVNLMKHAERLKLMDFQVGIIGI